MQDNELKKIIRETAGEEGLNCASAFMIAGKHDVPINKIGELCNELKIKIRNCQLGCFK
jgi:hypothetical protein